MRRLPDASGPVDGGKIGQLEVVGADMLTYLDRHAEEWLGLNDPVAVKQWAGRLARDQARASLSFWWGEQFDRLTLDALEAQNKPPLQFNRIERVA